MRTVRVGHRDKSSERRELQHFDMILRLGRAPRGMPFLQI